MRRTLCLVPLLLACTALAADPVKEPPLVVKPDAFETLVNPNCSHCRDEAKRRAGELRDDDRVLCWTRGYSDGGAIPFRFFLNPYRVISDSYGVFVHDPDAGFARGYLPSYHFRFHGWRNGVMVHEAQGRHALLVPQRRRLRRPEEGHAPDADPDRGERLGLLAGALPAAPSPTTCSTSTSRSICRRRPNKDAEASRGPADPRLPADEPVLGVWTGKAARAYPIAALAKAGLIAEEIDGQKCVVLWQPKTKTASAYRPEASPPRKYAAPRPERRRRIAARRHPRRRRRSRSLCSCDDKVPAAPFVDAETGSRWDVAGRAVEGELKGYTLTWLDSVQVKWFAWAAEYPKTTVYSRRQQDGQGGRRHRRVPAPAAQAVGDAEGRGPEEPHGRPCCSTASARSRPGRSSRTPR